MLYHEIVDAKSGRIRVRKWIHPIILLLDMQLQNIITFGKRSLNVICLSFYALLFKYKRIFVLFFCKTFALDISLIKTSWFLINLDVLWTMSLTHHINLYCNFMDPICADNIHIYHRHEKPELSKNNSLYERYKRHSRVHIINNSGTYHINNE